MLAEFRTGAILEAATHLFAEKGYGGVTVEEIARRAGIAKGTVYLYYASKDEVYRAAFARNIAELRERTEAAMAAAPTAAETIRAFVATKLRYLEEHRDFFRVYFSEVHPGLDGSPALRDEIEASVRGQLRVLAAELGRGVAAGEVRRTDVEAAARAVFDLTASVLRRRARKGRGAVEDDVAFVFDLLWKGLGAR